MKNAPRRILCSDPTWVRARKSTWIDGKEGEQRRERKEKDEEAREVKKREAL